MVAPTAAIATAAEISLIVIDSGLGSEVEWQ